MKWFKHDSNANMDAKIQEVLLDYGLEGLGLYWYCLELISSNVDQHNLSFELEHDARIIARNTGSSNQRVEEMMAKFIDLGLFEASDGIITCLKLAARTDEYTAKVLKSASKNPDSVPTVSRQTPDSVPIKSALLEENRIEQSRKEKKVTGRFTPPTFEEVRLYCKERKNNVLANEFIDHYAANGWMRGKNKIKDWKACVRTWEKNNPKPADKSASGYQIKPFPSGQQ